VDLCTQNLKIQGVLLVSCSLRNAFGRADSTFAERLYTVAFRCFLYFANGWIRRPDGARRCKAVSLSKRQRQQALAASLKPTAFGTRLTWRHFLTSARVEGSTYSIRRMNHLSQSQNINKPTLGTGSHFRLTGSSPVLLPAR
jgi:hypothetical protein